jgi:NADH dehydrogenase
MEPLHQIVIVGGGFAGIRTALALDKKRLPNVKIRLVSDKDHFEYPSAFYRLASGYSPLETYVPLGDIFDDTSVEVVEDSITSITPNEKSLHGTSGARYAYDTLVLALGSETAYFNIPGLKELAFSFKSVNDAIRLNRHLQQQFNSSVKETETAEKLDETHVVIVGGGASGTELAGELAVYLRKLCSECSLDPSLVTIELIEAAPRLLPVMPPAFSARVEARLRSLGVNILLNRAVLEQEVETTHLRDMELRTKTMVWTAGVRANELYEKTEGFETDKKGRVIVDEFLRTKGFPAIYIAGDGAATQYSGLAQTAFHNGKFVANDIAARLTGNDPKPYEPGQVASAIPIGPKWAGVMWRGITVYGRIGWWLRRLADLRVYLTILPLGKAWSAFKEGKNYCDAYPDCFIEPAPEKTAQEAS